MTTRSYSSIESATLANRAKDVFFRIEGRAAFLFCRETRQVGNTLHARMFAPAFGILEDPATGSAVAAFAGGQLKAASIAGDAVVVLEGTIDV